MLPKRYSVTEVNQGRIGAENVGGAFSFTIYDKDKKRPVSILVNLEELSAIARGIGTLANEWTEYYEKMGGKKALTANKQ